MPGIDLSSMQPPDAAVALRSLPRRYRDAARTASTTELDAEPDDPAIDEMAARLGPDGHSAADLVEAASTRATELADLLRHALVSDATVVPKSALDADPPVRHHPGASPFAAGVASLADACNRAAEVVENADAGRWTAELGVEGGGTTTTPLAVLQAGVAALVGWERELAPLLRSVRGRPEA